MMGVREYWYTIWEWKWMILALVGAATSAAAVDCLRRPVVYEAMVHILPTAPAWESDRGAPVVPVLTGLSLPFRVLHLNLKESIYWELYSRVLADAVIEELHLQQHYHIKTMSEARSALDGHRHIQLTQEGTLQVSVVDEDPRMAVAIANAHAHQLDRLDRSQLAKSVALRRKFFQKQMAERSGELVKIEKAWVPTRLMLMPGMEVADKGEADAKKNDRDESGESQGASGSYVEMKMLSDLKLEMMELEVEDAVLEHYATSNHPEAIQLQARLRALREAAHRREYGTGTNSNSGLFGPVEYLPRKVLANSRLGREAKLSATLYLHWRMMLESVQIEESLDMPRIWVLDWAIPVERAPRVWQPLLSVGELAFLFGVMLAFWFSYLDRLAKKMTLMQKVLPRQ